MKRLFVALVVGMLLGAANAASGQSQSTTAVSNEIAQLAGSQPDEQDELLAALEQNFAKVLLLPAAPATSAEQQRLVSKILAFRRADIQTGASSGASASTTVAASPLLPAIFGVAIENGALTRTVSGTAITLKLTPAGLLCAADPSAAEAVALREETECRTVWKRVGVTATFDASRGEKKKELADFKTLEGQFAELNVRVELLNRRKPGIDGLRRHFRKQYDAWQAAASNLGEQVNGLPAVVAARVLLRQRLTTLLTSETYRVLDIAKREAAIRQVVSDVASSATISADELQRGRSQWLTSLQGFDALARSVANAPVLTAEYGIQKPDLAKEDIAGVVEQGARPPSIHALRFIYAHGLPQRRIDVTANASLSLFHDVREGMSGRVRDARLAVEAKWKLRDIGNYGAPTLSMAGLYVYLHQQPLGLGLTAFNQAAIAEKGHIGLFQTKLEFPTGNNAVRIPLSFTYSNRTELIKESDVRGQFGLSFNLDALFASK